MRRLIPFLFLLLAPSAWATTTVTGTLQNLGTGNVGQGAFVRFWLRGCGGNQPRVSGTAVIAPSQGGVFFFDFAANGSGSVSGTLYSTRDATGLLGGDITCGTSTTSVWYGMQIFVGGKGGPEIPVHALNAATLDISSITPINTNPVIVAPTGDSTYIRKDGGNSPVPGNLGFQGINTHSGKETFANFNRFIFVDGTVYPLTPTGIVNAIAAASSIGGTVVIGPTGSTTIAMGTSQIVLPSNVCLIGGGTGGQTVLRWSSGIVNPILLNAGTVNACFENFTLSIPRGTATAAIRVLTSDAAPVINNTIKDLQINWDFSGGGTGPTAGSQGFFITRGGGDVASDFALNTIDNVIVNLADQLVLCTGCEGNFWRIYGQNLGATNGISMFVLTLGGDNVGDLRIESGSASNINMTCFNTSGYGNILRITCDGNNTGIISVTDTGGFNIFDIDAIGTPTLGGSIAATSTYRFSDQANSVSVQALPLLKVGNPIQNIAGTATMGLTLKKGSGAGNYTTASTTYVVADSTNLCLTVTIPTGWKLGVGFSGNQGTATAAVLSNYALTDNAACSTANAGILVEGTITTTGAGVFNPVALNWVITGDGAAHNIALQYKTSNGSDSATLLNASATQLPTMKFELMPSN